MAVEQPAARGGWLDVQEVGSLIGMRLMLWIATVLGRAPVRVVLPAIALYYAVLHRTARRSSREYLRRMRKPDGFIASYRHMLRFAQCSADRVFMIQSRHELFEVETTGYHHLEGLALRKRGAILLGAHLGSFEAMNAVGVEQGMVVNVVGYFRNARMINRLLERPGRGVHARLLEARPGSINFALELRECIERGEFIGILGDRAMGGQSVSVDFLGKPAPFPVGAYALAAILRCPVYLTFGLHRPPNRYELHCEPFAEQIVLPRRGRSEALQGHARRFARRLEHYCRLAPDNWFNFYDFWASW